MCFPSGYPSEEHTVMTEDGYFLVMHRIPSGRQADSNESLPYNGSNGCSDSNGSHGLSSAHVPSFTTPLSPMSMSRAASWSTSFETSSVYHEAMNGHAEVGEGVPATTDHATPIRRNGNGLSPKKPVVLFMHGCMMNSEGWVCLPDRTKSYAFVLADLG